MNPIFVWDEPPECTTDRGWCYVSPESHVEYGNPGFGYFESNAGCAVGNYLTYSHDRGPNGETVHAVCFYQHLTECRVNQRISLGYSWFHTIAEAKEFIQGNIRAYFGLDRVTGDRP